MHLSRFQNWEDENTPEFSNEIDEKHIWLEPKRHTFVMILARTHTQIQMSCLICCAHRIGRVCFVFVRTYVRIFFCFFFSLTRLSQLRWFLFIAWARCTFIRAFHAHFLFVRSFGRSVDIFHSNGICFNACSSWYLCFYIHIIFCHLWERHGHTTQLILNQIFFGNEQRAGLWTSARKKE